MKCILMVLLMVLPAAADDYVSSVERWHEKRLANLTRADGWLTLVGLDWLKEGDNDFVVGSRRIGNYSLRGRHVSLTVEKGVAVTWKGAPVQELSLEATEAEGAHTLSLGSLSWFVIERDGRVGVRVKDSESPVRTGFKGIEHFSIDRRWRVEGKFVPSPHRLPVQNVLGRSSFEESPGSILFEVGGKPFRLDAIQEKGDPNLFVIFGDATNGHGTYGGGRYLSVEPPDAQGRVFLEFNQAYNPPCAFTDYATCTLPPAQNRLAFKVEAGEKTFQHSLRTH